MSFQTTEPNIRNLDEVSKLLAVLIAEQGSYTYVDKLGYAPSTDLALFYLKEAARDFHSLKARPRFENTAAEEQARKVNLEYFEKALGEISRIRDRRTLRHVVSLISAKALAISARLIESRKTEGGKRE